MTEKYINEAYWEPGVSVFTEGSNVHFTDKQVAHFENKLMEPGSAIISWSSTGNYQMDRIVPQLPTLKINQSYRIVVDATAEPENSAFTRLTFYDLQGQPIDKVEFYDRDKEFAYPAGAYRYTVQIINAGCTNLTFNKLQIGDASLPLEAYDDWWVERAHHTDQWASMNVLVVRDPKRQRSTTLDFDKKVDLPFQVVHTSWQYTHDFAKDLEQWIWNHDLQDAHLVSSAKIFDVPLQLVHQSLPQTHLLLSTEYHEQLPTWASPEIASPDWRVITNAIKKRWGRG